MNPRRAIVAGPGAAPGGRSQSAPGGRSQPAPRGRAHEGDAPPRALEVYVVEDNAIVLESLVAALEELAPVRVVGNAADESVAVEWLAAGGQRCDLVIIDIFLRTGSGLGVIAAAREQRPEAALVVLSNYATDEMQARCLASGADRVFDKSRDIDQLVDYCIALSTRRGERRH